MCAVNVDGQPLLANNESFGSVNAPAWVPLVAEMKSDMEKSRDTIKALAKLHGARLKVTFGDEIVAQQERDIEILSQEITRLLKRTENNIKRVALVKDASGERSVEDTKARLNVMKAIGAELQQQSKSFRQLQKSFLKSNLFSHIKQCIHT